MLSDLSMTDNLLGKFYATKQFMQIVFFVLHYFTREDLCWNKIVFQIFITIIFLQCVAN